MLTCSFLFTLEEFARELSFLCENVADVCRFRVRQRLTFSWPTNLSLLESGWTI